MIIRELRIDGFRRIKAMTIRPNKSLILLTGANDAGKSSALQAIATALEGIAAAGATPIREGVEQAKINLDLGELTVERTFTRAEDGTKIVHKLMLTAADGSRITASPQAVLSALSGNLTFDPLAFSKMKPGEQFDALRSFVKDFDFKAHDTAQDADYKARTEANRVAAEHTAAAKKLVLPPGSKPDAVSVADLMDELAKAEEHNSQLAVRQERRKAAADAIEQKRDEAESLRARAATLEKEANDLEAKLAEAPALPGPVTVAPIKEKISSADLINATRRAHEQREEHERLAAASAQKSAELTAARERRDQEKKDAILKADLPAPGLDLVDGGVMLDGLPFAEAGTAKRIHTSMCVAMAVNPKLKIVLVDEGSECDAKTLEMVAKMAEEKGYQVWLTSCHHDSGQAEVVIEDGEVKK